MDLGKSIWGSNRQRRAYYRYQCSISMEERLMDSEEWAWMEENGMLVADDTLPVHTSTIRNIGGGGMKFTGSCHYETGDKVYGRFHFGKDYRLCMEILECCDSAVGLPGLYDSRARFVGMERREREAIIRTIFAAERADRKLELE